MKYKVLLILLLLCPILIVNASAADDCKKKSCSGGSTYIQSQTQFTDKKPGFEYGSFGNKIFELAGKSYFCINPSEGYAPVCGCLYKNVSFSSVTGNSELRGIAAVLIMATEKGASSAEVGDALNMFECYARNGGGYSSGKGCYTTKTNRAAKLINAAKSCASGGSGIKCTLFMEGVKAAKDSAYYEELITKYNGTFDYVDYDTQLLTVSGSPYANLNGVSDPNNPGNPGDPGNPGNPSGSDLPVVCFDANANGDSYYIRYKNGKISKDAFIQMCCEEPNAEGAMGKDFVKTCPSACYPEIIKPACGISSVEDQTGYIFEAKGEGINDKNRECVLGNSSFKDNTFEVNTYCALYCKEDIYLEYPGYGFNLKTGYNIRAGQYFAFRAEESDKYGNYPKIDQTRTCVMDVNVALFASTVYGKTLKESKDISNNTFNTSSGGLYGEVTTAYNAFQTAYKAIAPIYNAYISANTSGNNWINSNRAEISAAQAAQNKADSEYISCSSACSLYPITKENCNYWDAIKKENYCLIEENPDRRYCDRSCDDNRDSTFYYTIHKTVLDTYNAHLEAMDVAMKEYNVAKAALQKLRNTYYSKLETFNNHINEFTRCAVWKNDEYTYPEVKDFVYDEMKGNYSDIKGVLEKYKSNILYEVNKNIEKSAGKETLNKEFLSYNNGQNIQVFLRNIPIDDEGKQSIKISDYQNTTFVNFFDYAKDFIKAHIEYALPTFYTVQPDGLVVDNKNNETLNYMTLGTGLPVSINTKASAYNYAFTASGLGFKGILMSKYSNNVSEFDDIVNYSCKYHVSNQVTCPPGSYCTCDPLESSCQVPGGTTVSTSTGELNIITRNVNVTDINPNNRVLGTNWADEKGTIAKAKIENDGEDYLLNNNPMYSFVLDGNTIKEVKNYNSTTSYDDFNLKCNEGEACISEFLNSNLFADATVTRDKWYVYENGEYVLVDLTTKK